MTNVKDTAEPYPLDEPEKSLGDLVGELTHQFGELVTDHLRLAKIEIVDELKDAGRGAGIVGGGAIAGWIAALILSMAAAWGLAEAMDTWLAFLVVGLVWAIAAAVLFTTGKKALQQVDPIPKETIHELEKDKQWISERN
jgi:uncharacterized membrane protein YqjE